jgi:hypothetical protein
MSIYFRLERRIDPLALVISSSIVDLEPFFVLLFNLQQPPHGFWHSYFGVLLLSVPLTLGVYLVESKGSRAVERSYRILKIDSAQVKHGLGVIFYTNLVGGFSHVFFDMFTHKSFPYVLYPLVKFSNPFWMGLEVAMVVEAFVVLLSAYSCWLWIESFFRKKATKNKPLTT